MLKTKEAIEYAIKTIKEDSTEILQNDLLELNIYPRANKQIIDLIVAELKIRGASRFIDKIVETHGFIKSESKVVDYYNHIKIQNGKYFYHIKEGVYRELKENEYTITD